MTGAAFLPGPAGFQAGGEPPPRDYTNELINTVFVDHQHGYVVQERCSVDRITDVPEGAPTPDLHQQCSSHLLATADAGHTWQERTLPGEPATKDAGVELTQGHSLASCTSAAGSSSPPRSGTSGTTRTWRRWCRCRPMAALTGRPFPPHRNNRGGPGLRQIMSVRELRLVVTVDDHEQALRFYRDVLGLPELADFSSPDGNVRLLDAGRATVEIVDRRQAEFIDRVEVGERVAGHIRVALEVDNATDGTASLVEAGATVLAEPTRTPWNSLNARLTAPDGLQLTLFEELG